MKLHELIAELSAIAREQESTMNYDVLVLDSLENILGEVERVTVDNDPDNDKLVIALKIKED